MSVLVRPNPIFVDNSDVGFVQLHAIDPAKTGGELFQMLLPCAPIYQTSQIYDDMSHVGHYFEPSPIMFQ